MIRDRILHVRGTPAEDARFRLLAEHVGTGIPLSTVVRALLADAADRVLGPEGSVQTPEGRRIVRDIDDNGRKA